MRTLIGLFLALLSIWMAQPVIAKDESCTDGQTCFCDCINDTDGSGNNQPPSCTPNASTCFANTTCQTHGTPIVPTADRVLCEDYEGNYYNGGCGTGTRRFEVAYPSFGGSDGSCGTTDGYTGWLCCGSDGLQNTLDEYHNHLIGSGKTTAMTIMRTPDGSGCTENASETDCVFQGTQSMAERYWGYLGGGSAGANLGDFTFPDAGADFSIQIIRKWTGNFLASSEDCTDSGSAASKDWELSGAAAACIPGFPFNYTYNAFGLDVTQLGANMPYGGLLCGSGCSASVGTCVNDGGTPYYTHMAAPLSVWDWRGTGNAGYSPVSGQAIWTAWTLQDTGYGTSGARHRQFVNKGRGLGREEAINFTYNGTGAGTMNRGFMDAYYNNFFWGIQANPNCTPDQCNAGGYCSTATEPGYRLKDNFLIKKGAPLTDLQLGFPDNVNSGGGSPPPEPTVTGAGFALREPTQDTRPTANGGPQPLRTLQECKVERYLDGALFDTIRRASSAPTGGGTWPTENTLAGIDPVTHCGKTVSFRAFCRNQATMPAGTTGTSALASSPKLAPVTLPACPPPPEWAPQPPVISQLDALLERIYSPAWAAGLR